MKNLLILLLILSLLLSCSSRTKQLEGNWYSCNLDGEYLEFFTKKDSFKILSNVGLESSWTHYRIEADTMYFIKPNDTDSAKAFLNYKHGKSLTMEFFDGNEKLNFKPLIFVLNKSKFKDNSRTEIYKRAKNAECIR